MTPRTDRQELNFRGAINRIIWTTLEAFAFSAAVTIRRGHVYRASQELGVSALEITTELGRDLRHLERAGDLADTYGRPNTAEFRHATWQAFSSFGLGVGTVTAAIESDAVMLRTLGPTGRFARALVEWRRLAAAGEPPPAESVACQLGHFLGRAVDESTSHDIVRDLTRAFRPEGVPPHDQLAAVVTEHCGAVVTEALCRRIAEAAVGTVAKLGSDEAIGVGHQESSNGSD